MLMRALPPRARLLALLVILSNLAGNALLSKGMRGGELPWALLQPFTIAGIALLILWTVARASLLSWADLSYVLPLTAVGYVLTAVVGAAFLGEHVTPIRWAATFLIVAGIVLAGLTPARTTGPEKDRP
jgi:drug/metabolite transporter (DMT)-like permease